jgi:hypothetical protein
MAGSYVVRRSWKTQDIGDGEFTLRLYQRLHPGRTYDHQTVFISKQLGTPSTCMACIWNNAHKPDTSNDLESHITRLCPTLWLRLMFAVDTDVAVASIHIREHSMVPQFSVCYLEQRRFCFQHEGIT